MSRIGMHSNWGKKGRSVQKAGKGREENHTNDT